MALARVVSFEDVDGGRVAELSSRMESSGPPEGMPPAEFLLFHDASAGRALAIMVFDSEEDYRRGEEILEAMPAGETPGRRTSVAKYEVAVRASA